MTKTCLSKTEDSLRIFLLSDPHFANPRVSSLSTLQAIRRYFPDNEETGKYDICFVAGDYFDHQVHLSDQSVYAIQASIVHLLRVCKKWNIKLRVLEGTRSHDRLQSINFEWLNEIVGINADLKYHTTMVLEYIEDLDINVLYVPDEWNPDASVTYEQAKELIRSRGLDKVELAIMHGAWLHQLPGIPSPAYHDAVLWSELVLYHIFSGHIHTHSVFLKQVSIGSVGRYGHNEEEPKGFLDVLYANKKVKKFRFIENKLAKKFITLNVIKLPVNDIIVMINDLRGLLAGSAIRLEYGPEDPIKAIREVIDITFPQYVFTDIKRDDKKTKHSPSQPLLMRMNTNNTPISPENIGSLLTEYLLESGTDSQLVKEVVALVQEV